MRKALEKRFLEVDSLAASDVLLEELGPVGL